MQGAADRTNRVAYGAIKHATYGAACRADNAAHQAIDAQRAVLRRHGRLAGQLQIAVGHDFVATGACTRTLPATPVSKAAVIARS